MGDFQYFRPESIRDVSGLLVEHGPAARLLAGGTDLLVRIKSGRQAPAVVIDIKRVRELSSELVIADGKLRVGALTLMADVAASPLVRQFFPALAEAAGVVGSGQIRHRATLVGNVCNASPAADTATPLLVYGATVTITGPAGERTVPLTEFFVGPGRTALQLGELVCGLEIPVPEQPAGSAFARLTRIQGVDLATTSVACLITRNGTARVAFGAVGPVPILTQDESGLLAARGLDPAERDRVIEGLVTAASPITDVRATREYRLAMLPVYTRRALAVARKRLYGEEGTAQ